MSSGSRRRPSSIAIVVAVDPPVTATASSDACGLVVAGIGPDRRAYVIADRTLQGREPAAWARAAVAAYRDFAADRIIAEVNQGGDLVESVIRQVDPNVPIGLVRATRGKWVRAEPVAALYAEGRVAHVGQLPLLEAQLLAFGIDGLASGQEPRPARCAGLGADRADARPAPRAERADDVSSPSPRALFSARGEGRGEGQVPLRRRASPAPHPNPLPHCLGERGLTPTPPENPC